MFLSLVQLTVSDPTAELSPVFIFATVGVYCEAILHVISVESHDRRIMSENPGV